VGVNLTERARLQGLHPQTAYRWFGEDRLPVPAVRVIARTALIGPDADLAPTVRKIGLYARVSSHDQEADLDRQVEGGPAPRGPGRGHCGGAPGPARGMNTLLVKAALAAHRRRPARNRAANARRCAVRDVAPSTPGAT
jgi:hypothetical protein